ncbi:MAG: dTMP kinase [Stygiobacter sp. RIFOXYC12_FULL_38_8]|nr:MAG: dTMP kinase [Stygiobacter sp. GWC2_38_9]OGU83845.1 MAG: dTMP kinase [Stygiobacter sp. RIFOXYA12_FULL_38_9]OGV06262.1 MAG: dTMP kinase [Stygiobacter sp. RIFOXYB2_FULL_37_11]OGV14362.1 MAG: dTMP kinase [Stygiobacter sp. RIFOXYA2_FULL_38_8]OGV16013.1 MAG: dTMP kinase [Stygiobacter sp. RIFOXYC2_FULL_38_25]OGV23792.1 MAG: dTMP kinase [Stygiobacter sp. RIFOXYC12_FULL_38_8]OGV80490.1 MAG: dTMP kinase [Stygiobacter sp. GWF2_38_21]OGV85565.1 MAG: dTMP kinase [Melioribacter sp. RIFOXYB12_FULL_
MFITFEGLDFCGKSTQVQLLEKLLTGEGKKVKVIREPGGTIISEKIRNVLLDKKNSEMLIETELILFAASRAQLVGEVILPLLDENSFVISDRFHDSSIAYQAFGRGIDLEFVDELQKFVIGRAIPDLTFLIDIPIEEVVRRKTMVKHVELDRIERSEMDFYEKVREGYLFLASRESRFRRIDGMLAIEEIHKVIVDEITKYSKG